jgi:hypothetical protein
MLVGLELEVSGSSGLLFHRFCVYVVSDFVSEAHLIT